VNSNNLPHARRAALVSIAAAFLCLLAASPSQAAVREIFACSYVDGADRDDLMKARDNLVRQSEALGLEGMDSFLWTPYKVQAFDRDFIWFNQFEDLATFAAAADAYASTDAGRSVQARFDEIVECSASMADIETVYSGGSQPASGPVVVESFGCTLHEGQGPAAVADLITHYRGVLAEADGYETHGFFTMTPLLGSPDAFDRVFFGIHDDVKTWAARASAMQASEAGAMFGRHAAQVVDCGSALWWAEWIVEGEE